MEIVICGWCDEIVSYSFHEYSELERKQDGEAIFLRDIPVYTLLRCLHGLQTVEGGREKKRRANNRDCCEI